MIIKQHCLQTMIAIYFCILANSSWAISTGNVLAFDTGQLSCNLGLDPSTSSGCLYDSYTISGSYFGMDADGSGTLEETEKTIMAMHDGLIIGATQTASGAHSGAPDGTESPGIDEPWYYFGNTGMHLSVTPTSIISTTTNTVDLDFTGWSILYDGLDTPVDLGGDDDDWSDGATSWGTGIAQITCTVDCGVGDSFILDYAVSFSTCISCFGGINYSLHLEGTVSAVPVPAAVWLFGSGLLGVIGMGKRKKIAGLAGFNPPSRLQGRIHPTGCLQ